MSKQCAELAGYVLIIVVQCGHVNEKEYGAFRVYNEYCRLRGVHEVYSRSRSTTSVPIAYSM